MCRTAVWRSGDLGSLFSLWHWLKTVDLKQFTHFFTPKLKNCYLHLYESLGNKLTVSSEEEASHFAHSMCVSGMGLGRGVCQPVTYTQLCL